MHTTEHVQTWKWGREEEKTLGGPESHELEESCLWILESSQIKARVMLEIVIMSQEQKTTKGEGDMNGGWKMTTT